FALAVGSEEQRAAVACPAAHARPDGASGFVHIFGTGLATGLLQWLVLGQPFGAGLQPGPAFAAIAGIAGGSVFGATSAAVWVWLLRREALLGVTRRAAA